MQPIQCGLLILTIISTFAATQSTAEDNLVQSIWRPCGSELQTPQSGEDVQVFVPLCQPVNGTESRCILRKGLRAAMIIKFKATQSVPTLERIIVARVPAAFDKKVEMPYGPAISPCVNSSMVATDGSECLSEGVEAGKNYTYTSFFDVLRSFPTVQDVETRIILRQKHEKHRKIRLYKKHPGPTVFCVVIPNIEVAE